MRNGIPEGKLHRHVALEQDRPSSNPADFPSLYVDSTTAKTSATICLNSTCNSARQGVTFVSISHAPLGILRYILYLNFRAPQIVPALSALATAARAFGAATTQQPSRVQPQRRAVPERDRPQNDKEKAAELTHRVTQRHSDFVQRGSEAFRSEHLRGLTAELERLDGRRTTRTSMTRRGGRKKRHTITSYTVFCTGLILGASYVTAQQLLPGPIDAGAFALPFTTTTTPTAQLAARGPAVRTRSFGPSRPEQSPSALALGNGWTARQAP